MFSVCANDNVQNTNTNIGVLNSNIFILLLAESSTANCLEEFLQEAIAIKDFDHPNVMKLTGVVHDDEGSLIVLPYMDNGDLRSFVFSDKHVRGLNIPMSRELFKRSVVFY